jgi:threonine dehydratase
MSPVVIDDLVKDILTARVYDVAIESPLERAPKLSAATNNSVYLKREDLQPVHSFKLRGAYNKISRLTKTEKAQGVIAVSAGNHAQGVALAAQKLRMSALIVMPRTTPSIKVEAVKNLGADIELVGDNYSEAAEYCKQRVQETSRTFIHPFDDPLVIAGQGTVGREILEQLPDATHVFVPVGGGGLLAGVAQYIKAISPEVKIISVQTEDANTMQPSLRASKRVQLAHVGIFADGTAVKQLGERTFEIAKRYVDGCVTVTTDQLCAAIKAIFEDTRSIVEPSGALAVAGIQQYKLPANAKAVAICSGANMTFERLQQIAERTLLGSGKEALFAVSLPELPGALQKFCTKVVSGHSITEFEYRLHKRNQAHIMVGISVASQKDKQSFMAKMQRHGFEHVDLSDDDTAKEHIRHMIGGKSAEAKHEHMYQVEFPERPGALADFLTAVGNDWNISLFHYRSAASDTGNVLIGFEVADREKLEQRLRTAGFGFASVDKTKSAHIFIT